MIFKKSILFLFIIIIDNMEGYILFIKKMNSGLFNLHLLSPTGLIGFWVLFIGLVFTGIMFYFVFFRLNEVHDSYKDRERKKIEEEKRKESIARLYPKGN